MLPINRDRLNAFSFSCLIVVQYFQYNVVFKFCISNPREKVFSVSPLNMMIVVRFLEMFFIRLWRFPSISSLLIFFLIHLFIYGCVGSSLLCAGFLQWRRVAATLCCGGRASHCGGFSCCRARALGSWASVVVARGLSSCGSWALEHRLSSCGAGAQLPHGMWDLSSPTRDQTRVPCIGRWILNHWTTREVPLIYFFNANQLCIPRINSTYVQIQFADILLRFLVPVFMADIGL